MVYLVQYILVLVLFKSIDNNNSVINSFPNSPEKWFLLFNSLQAQQKTSLPHEEWPHLLHSFPPAEEYLLSPPLLLLFSHSVMSNSCDPMDCSAPGSSVHGISQGRILQWVAIFSSRASSWPKDQTRISCIAGIFFTAEPLGKPLSLWPTVNLSTWAENQLHILPTFPGNILLIISFFLYIQTAAAAKSLQSCPTLWDPIDGSPSGSPVPGILQARTLEWVAISFSNAWKWKVKVKSLSRVQLFSTPWTAAYQAPRSMGFSKQEYWRGVPSPSPTTPSQTVF